MEASKSVDLAKDPRFAVPGVGSKIITAEDAEQAYLREEISEDELRAVYGRYGKTEWLIPPGRIERPDDAFARDIPEDLLEGQVQLRGRNLDERLDLVNDKDEVRQAATEAAEKVEADVKPETDLATAKNAASEKAAEKVEEKQS